MMNVNTNTIVSVNSLVCANEVPDYLSEWDIQTLENYGFVETTRIGDLLYPFNDEEKEYIIAYLNSLIDEGCEFDIEEIIPSICMNTEWVNVSELEDEYNEAAANDDVSDMSFDEWLRDSNHVYHIDKYRAFIQAC